jgi:Ca2+-binding EF-hand superfamily protein
MGRNCDGFPAAPDSAYAAKLRGRISAVIDRVTGLLIALGLATGAAPPPTGKPPTSPKAPAAVPVPRADFIRTMDAEFAKMDADQNKVVTRAEIEQYERAANLLQARAAAHLLFEKMDTDRNGQLSPAEFEHMVTPAAPNPAPILAQHDLNKDGKITLVEYRTAKLANFDRMDADKDGVVSVAEMRAAGLVK